ncbi:MAG: lipid II:glycine glycyltransferase FemX, partial [Thermodesulfobacteriota bacterium]
AEQKKRTSRKINQEVGKAKMQVALKPKKTRRVLPTPYLQQTAYWSRLKQKQGRRTAAFDILVDAAGRSGDMSGHAAADGDMLVVLRPIAHNVTMAYVPFGPELLPDEEMRGVWLEELSEQMRPHLPDNCLFVRYDLPWRSPWADEPDRYTENERWKGPPKVRIQEMRMNFDTEKWNLRKAPTDLLPPDTVIIDVGVDRDRILSRMKSKTRYNIRLSGRKGVRIREAGIEGLPAWYELYRDTAIRHKMDLNDMAYFSAAFNVADSDCDSPARMHLLLAEVGDRPVAGIMLAISGNRATYLYGASSSDPQDRKFMAPYALQWEAIRRARKGGCKDYDMFGVSPVADPVHPMYGLYRFKTGFGGRMQHRQGCWDYPFDEARYDVYRASELAASPFAGG